ncbi:MAG: hypothetical protein QUV05_16985 [Phycisphaerae bacterium]|nr:hypothetical protein [Phycisphaerae bacterium]
MMGVPSSKVLSFLAGLADCRGWLAEMYTYQAYGDAQIWLWPEGDINRDGTTNYLDLGMVMAGRGKALDPLLDANLDGGRKRGQKPFTLKQGRDRMVSWQEDRERRWAGWRTM